VKKLFFFNCTYGGLGRRFGNPVHAQTVWYQYFHQKPWMEKLVGHSRETCRIYIDAMVRSWTHDPDCFDAADIDAFVDDLMDREGLRGGMAWYRGLFELRLKMMTQGPIQMPVISIPTRFLWGGLDPILPAEWTDALGDYFSRFRLSVVPDAGHFVHYEKPALANEEMLRFFLDAAATG
jgi:pimeloyl-ACP methyl ester carboxylesterase